MTQSEIKPTIVVPGKKMTGVELQQYLADMRRSDKRSSFVAETRATKRQKAQLRNS